MTFVIYAAAVSPTPWRIAIPKKLGFSRYIVMLLYRCLY